MSKDSNPEEWRPVVGYEGRYEVSSLGNVRSVDRTIMVVNRGVPRLVRYRGKPLKPGRTGARNMYWGVAIRCGPSSRTYAIHRLVCEAFHGPQPTPSMEVRHLDGNPLNNHKENLSWGTHTQNMRDMVEHKTHHNMRKTACKWGHEFTPENTKMVGGARTCITCRKRLSRESARRIRSQKRQGVVRV